VPSRRVDLYKYPIDWNGLKLARVYDRVLYPFILRLTRKILGEEEKNLTEFIIKQVSSRKDPANLESKLIKAIDTEAPILVKRIWRVLIFEHLKISKQ
jgi:hypothetical protein